MIKIPSQTNEILVRSESDKEGNIFYTKNLNLDEKGYIQLSSRTLALQSEKDDDDFDIITGWGRYSGNFFHAVTLDRNWEFTLTPIGITSNINNDEDPTEPGGGQNSWGVWWQGIWHITTSTKLYTSSSNTWSDKSISLTSGKDHAMAVFKNRETLCIANGNAIKQIDTSYATTDQSQLTIPSDYEIIGLAYNNQSMGIITTLSSTANGTNQNALFFIWSGDSNQAGAGYDIGSQSIVAIRAYKSSFVIFTEEGKLLYFNGGGFDELATLPFYNKRINYGSLSGISKGNIIFVQDDKIFINVNNEIIGYDILGEQYIENFPCGIYCYDPKVGFYHRYSPSVSKYISSFVADSNVDITLNTLTANDNIIPETGSIVTETSGSIGGITKGKPYFLIRISSTKFQIAETHQGAIDLQAIDLTSIGDDNNYFSFAMITDYGIAYSDGKSASVVDSASVEIVSDHLLYSGEYYDSLNTQYAYAEVTVPNLESIGYYVTPRISSDNVTDNFQKIYIRYLPLNDTSSITAKYKTRDIYGLPVTTTQNANDNIATWTSQNTFTTTADISVAMNYLTSATELECEVLSGASAGVMSKVTSITYNAGVYTVTIEDSLLVSVDDNSHIKLDSWKVIGVITSADSLGYKEFSVAQVHKDIKFKVVYRGYDIKSEQLQIINKTQQASV